MPQRVVDKSGREGLRTLKKSANGKPYLDPSQQRVAFEWPLSQQDGIR